MMLRSEAEGIVNSSRLLRLRRRDSVWLIENAIAALPLQPPGNVETRKLFENSLKTILERRIRERYGNPFIVFFLLKVILPIVIRLVIEWWLNSRTRLDWVR